MGLRLGRGGAVVGVVAGLVVLGGAGVALRGDEPVRLAGAERLADPDGRGVGFLTSGDNVAGRPVDDARMSSASDLAAGDGELFILFDGIPDGDEGELRVTPDGKVDHAGFARLATAFGTRDAPGITAVGLGPAGEWVVAIGAEVFVYGFDMADAAEAGRLHEVEAPFEVGAVGVVGRDEVVLGGVGGGVVVRVTPGGVAPFVEDERLGAITGIAPLGGGRVAVVGDGRLFVVDDGGAQVVDTGDGNPVAAEPGETGGLVRRDRWPMAPISAGPDGTVVAVGEHDGHPRITLVDPGSGDVEVLADLEGVEATVEERVAAAIVGDDLFFLAEGSLWRKDDVITG